MDQEINNDKDKLETTKIFKIEQKDLIREESKDDSVGELELKIIAKPKNQKKEIGKITILVMAFIIGLLIVVQLRTAENVTGELSASQKYLQLQKSLNNVREERSLKEAELAELEKIINELQTGAGVGAVGSQLQNEIKKYDEIIGYTAVTGPGIILSLTDEVEGHLLENNYELILSVINKLNAAGAEGLSLNNIRWALDSYLNLKGGVLYLNDTPIKAPFEIAAIGDSSTLEASLNLRFGILYDLKNNYKIEGIIEKSDEITLPKLNRTLTFEYGQVEE